MSHFCGGAIAYLEAVEEATQLLQTLGFEVTDTNELSVALTNGSMQIRLMRGPSHIGPILTLELESSDLEASRTTIEASGGTVEDHPNSGRPDRLQLLMSHPCGIDLLLVKHLDEDDLDIRPNLPKELVWSPEAEHLLKEVIRTVPIPFRGTARRRVTAHSEALARDDQRQVVQVCHTVRGLIERTPGFQQKQLLSSLAEHGIDVGAFPRSSQPTTQTELEN